MAATLDDVTEKIKQGNSDRNEISKEVIAGQDEQIQG